MVMQRIANPCTPVRLRSVPPYFCFKCHVSFLTTDMHRCIKAVTENVFPSSSVVEQVTVNHLVGGSNPSWGAILYTSKLSLPYSYEHLSNMLVNCYKFFHERKNQKSKTFYKNRHC